MLETIERIPVQLNDILNNKDQIIKSTQDYLQGKQKIKKIVFVASGTSYNAAFTTKKFAEDFVNIPIELVYPNIFVNYLNESLLNEETLYIFISQGGKTKLVYEALEIVQSKRLLNISITESLDTPIASLADLAIEMGSEDEDYVFRTLGYSTTCATLYWIYISITKLYNRISDIQEQALIQDFSTMIENLPKIKQDTLKWYEQNKFTLMQKDHFVFTGTNDLWPVAQEADIKFMEMLPALTNSFELEELIHGPQNAFDQTTGYFILSRKDEDSDKVKNIVDFINEEVTKCFVIGEEVAQDTDLQIVSPSKYFSSLEYITVFQVLSYKLSTDKGRDLTKGIYPQVATYVEKSL